MLARLIEAARGAEFEPFSRDGAFLEVHRLGDLERFLGTPDDERLNLFTARMLLLLESRCLLGRAAYTKAVEFVLGLYSRDAPKVGEFRPLFLINDIVRYWKTLCLSYEAGRTPERDGTTENGGTQEQRLANLKLRFNRAWLCFNGLAYLLAGVEDRQLSLDRARSLVRTSPVERMLEVARRVADAATPIQAALDEYAWFLERSGGTKAEVTAWLQDDANWREARRRGDRFGDCLWELLLLLGERASLTRYLLI